MLKAKIESLLFIANRPMTVAKLAEVLGTKRDQVEEAIAGLAEKYDSADSGIRILRNADSVQMSTAPETAATIQEFLKDETTGEMTRPSLETLTIVAYRGPIAKAELEEIRGVNCSLILRNLMLRGLVEAKGEPGNPGTTYGVTMDFLRFLGVSEVTELPDYGKLNSHENVIRVLERATEEKAAAESVRADGDSGIADGGPETGTEGTETASA
ncbi:SMC-Scp complex subunit ScpB [Candidatus Uhrbacteria bacterium]|nr:SMC-Scp complex subunit ScpB [Candidatus Uhrbacteria bacterium]